MIKTRLAIPYKSFPSILLQTSSFNRQSRKTYSQDYFQEKLNSKSDLDKKNFKHGEYNKVSSLLVLDVRLNLGF